jgi:DegV family protein with EDD domain
MYRIISDSACDLSQAYVEKHDISIVPLSVSFDGENYYQDRIDITRNECYQKMVDNPDLYPKTSLPSVDLYYTTFEEYVKQDIPVVCLTISVLLSGSYNSAMNAKELIEEEYPDAQIYVLDSKHNCASQALVVDQMVRMRDAGLSLDEALKKMDRIIADARIFFTVGSLDYLQMGGRIGKLATVASKIDVKPIIIFKDGDVNLGGIGRNRNKLKKKVLAVADKYLTEYGKDKCIVSIGYGYDAAEGVSFMNEAEETLGISLNSETNVAIGVVSGVHTGPYPIGIACVPKFETIQL